MRRIVAKRAPNHHLVLVLIAGFVLVILLLLLAGGLGLREAQLMHQSAARMSAEQTATSRVLAQLQAEQRTMSDVLYRLLHRQSAEDEAEILQRIDNLDKAIGDLESRTQSASGSALSLELAAANRDFSAAARSLIENPTREYKTLVALLQHHQHVQQVAQEAILHGLQDATGNGKILEARANRMVRVSLSLLGAGLALAVGCAVLTVRFAASTLRLIEEQSTELSRVSWQMLQGQEDAARRFSHELHDELGQSLTAVKASLLSLSADTLDEKRADCIQLVDDSISNVRELSQLLRPVILDDFGLDAALHWLCDRFRQRTGIAVDYQCRLNGRLPDAVETQLFRITQEALTNIARHSQASEVSVRLEASETVASLVVADNGIGVDLSSIPRGGMGLGGMRTRAEQAGGFFQLRRGPKGGLEVMAEIPIGRETNDALT